MIKNKKLKLYVDNINNWVYSVGEVQENYYKRVKLKEEKGEKGNGKDVSYTSIE